MSFTDSGIVRNYLAVILRSTLRHPGFSFVQLLSYSIALAAITITFVFVRYEFSFDKYHSHSEEIYRIYMERTSGADVISWARTPAPLWPSLQGQSQLIHSGTRIRKNPRTDLFRMGNTQFYEASAFFADSSVFDVFDFLLLVGDPNRALARPNSVVLTRSMATKYFGDTDPIGQSLSFENKVDIEVTGILADVPTNSHFVPDFLISFSTLEQTIGKSRMDTWVWVDHHTYIRLHPGVEPATLEELLPDMLNRVSNERFASLTVLHLQPLADIHLHSQLKDEITPNGDASYLYVLSSAGLLILMIAGINYLNMSFANSEKRSHEIGLRKVMGANRSNLNRQFFGESLTQASVASIIGIFLFWLTEPFFSDIVGTDLRAAASWPSLVALWLGITLFISLVASSFPVLSLSSKLPVHNLFQTTSGKTGGGGVRTYLIVSQFVIAFVLIVGTITTYQQMSYLSDESVGFDSEQIIVTTIRDRDRMREQMPAIKNALMGIPGVSQVTASSSLPGIESHMTFRFQPPGTEESMEIPTFIVDSDFLDTYKIELLSGRSFSELSEGDSTSAVILNASAVRYANLEEPIGAVIDARNEWTVIGVAEDFQFQSLHSSVEPLVILPGQFYRFISIKIDTENVQETIAGISEVWDRFTGGRPFQYEFISDQMDNQYRSEGALAEMIQLFAIFALFVAGIGLFGLASFLAARRTKEIGIRKVMGATSNNILIMVGREFGRNIALSILIASPIAIIISRWWLGQFAFSVGFSFESLFIAGLACLVLGAFSVSGQALGAASANPVDSLRYE